MPKLEMNNLITLYKENKQITSSPFAYTEAIGLTIHVAYQILVFSEFLDGNTKYNLHPSMEDKPICSSL